eukprot:398174_1
MWSQLKAVAHDVLQHRNQYILNQEKAGGLVEAMWTLQMHRGSGTSVAIRGSRSNNDSNTNNNDHGNGSNYNKKSSQKEEKEYEPISNNKIDHNRTISCMSLD